MEYLPDGVEHKKEELLEILKSPQFNHGMRSLGQALRSGQLGPVLIFCNFPHLF